MTKEQKEFLADLSARLPYGVKCRYNGKDGTLSSIRREYNDVTNFVYYDCYFIEDEWGEVPIEKVYPYLRPLSSMTEDEKLHVKVNYRFFYNDGVFENIDIFTIGGIYDRDGNYDEPRTVRETLHVTMNDVLNLINWLNKHHFDYRGLIEKGRALDAGDMYEDVVLNELKKAFPKDMLTEEELATAKSLFQVKNTYLDVVKYIHEQHPEYSLKESKAYFDIYIDPREL